jgi:hypothetical protein
MALFVCFIVVMTQSNWLITITIQIKRKKKKKTLKVPQNKSFNGKIYSSLLAQLCRGQGENFLGKPYGIKLMW